MAGKKKISAANCSVSSPLKGGISLKRTVKVGCCTCDVILMLSLSSAMLANFYCH